MSSILKALRKLEEEKAARRDGGIVDVARDILRPERHRRGVPWRGPVAVAGTVLLLAVGGFSLLPGGIGSSAPVSRDIRPGSAVASLNGTASGRTVVSPQEQVVEQTLPPDVPPIILEQQSPAVPPPVAAVPSEPPAVSSAAVVKPPSPMPAEAVMPAPDVPTASPGSPPPAVSMGDPPLVVESIIFHLEPETRMAVINGLPVMQGTVTDGVTVEEILADRIRFSRDGRIFEIVVK